MTGGNSDLPDGWVTTTLGKVRLDLSKSIDPRKSGAEMFELYSVPSFSDRRPEIVSGNTVGSSKRTVEPNSVLLCKINPRINRVWVVRDYSQHRKIASTEWLCFSELSGLFPDFLCYSLRQDSFREYLASNASGVGGSLMRVRDATFTDYPFPLPPLPEQHRIVAEIEKQFTRLDASVAALKRVQANLKRYRASVLKAACEGKLVPTEAELARTEGRNYDPADRLLQRILTERRARWESHEKRRGNYKEPVAPDTSALPELPEGWVWSTLAQISGLKGGVTKGRRYRAGELLTDVPYLRVANVQRGYLDLSVIKTIKVTKEIADQLALVPGDILFTEGGDRDKLGRGWVWNGEIEGCIYQNHVFRSRLLLSELHPEFVSWWGNSFGQIFFNQSGKQTTNLASINLSVLSGFPVPLPPLAEQRRIVAEVERRLSVIQQTEATVQASLTRAERLRQSILKQAFSGKLVPQDPNDEPASELLKRIRAEREAAQLAASNRHKPRRSKISSQNRSVLKRSS